MIKTIWETIIYEPLYNLLVYLLNIVPFHEAGLAIITLTVLVRLVLYPLYKKTIHDQFVMREMQPKIDEIQKRYANDKQTLGVKLMELYKQEKVNPFSSFFLLIFIQLPILFGLIYVFSKGFLNHQGNLYSFIQYPVEVTTIFLGINLLAKGNIIMSLLAGAAQFTHSRIMFNLQKLKAPTPKIGGEKSFQEQFAKSMQVQVTYVVPVLIIVSAYAFPAAIALYWITNSLFSIAQEYIIRRQV